MDGGEGGSLRSRRTYSMTVDLRRTTIDRRRSPAANAITLRSPTGSAGALLDRRLLPAGYRATPPLIPTFSAWPLDSHPMSITELVRRISFDHHAKSWRF